MDDEPFSTTLAYTKSPKASRRTTFQDELKQAVSARGNRHSYSDYGNFSYCSLPLYLNSADILKLLKIQKQKKERYKAAKTKGKINNFKLSDDEEENVKPKNADAQPSSFHSTQSRNTSQSPSNSYTPEKNQQSDSPFSSLSDKFQPESTSLQKDEQSKLGLHDKSHLRKSLSESPLPLNSENSQWESSIPLTSDGSQWDSPLPLPSEKNEDNQMIGEKFIFQISHISFLYCASEQRTANMCDIGQLEEETQAETTACSRTATSSMSIDLSNTFSTEKSQISTNDSVLFSSYQLFKYVFFILAASEESKEKNYSTSFEEKHVKQYLLDIRPSSSQSSSSRKSKSSYTAESKYLGTLKVLDRRTQETQEVPEAADSLRAAVYQEWLKKKEETLKITRKAKKQEEKLKEEKMLEEKFAKISDAKVSYDAWKEKKSEVIKKKVKENQEAIKQQQMEMDKKQEKKETAKQVFEKWKEEHDSSLKDRVRQKKQTERRSKKKKRGRSTPSLSDQKKDVIEEKIRAERRKEKIKEVEEKYEKEEKEKMALEMYEKWLKIKEFQQKRERKEKRIQAILQDEPPPPWSPPNKTIPFGK
uniref:Microtubule-associated protein 9 n=1 Tax=Sinocyclocheilus anshuiensis TaxID=1608454 RepID=A0A671K308_9TELE